MKVKFNHELDDLDKLIEKAEVTDLPTGVTEEQAKKTILEFATNIQVFHLGLMIEFLVIREEKELRKVSEFVEIVFNDLGYEKFQKFTKIITDIAEKETEADGEVPEAPEAPETSEAPSN